MQKTISAGQERERIGIRGALRKIKIYNWMNPIILFVALYHFTATVHDAALHFKTVFSYYDAYGTAVVNTIEHESLIAIIVSLIVGIVGGIIQVTGTRKWKRVKEYWENNYWKDMVCFLVVVAIVLIIGFGLIQVFHSMEMETMSEQIAWVVLFWFPQMIYVLDVIPGAIAYYLILLGSRK